MTQQRDPNQNEPNPKHRVAAWIASGAIAAASIAADANAQTPNPAQAVQPKPADSSTSARDKAAVPAVAVTHAIAVRPGELRVRFLSKETRRPLPAWQASVRRTAEDEVVAKLEASDDGSCVLPAMKNGERVVLEVGRGLTLGIVADEQATVTAIDLAVPRSVIEGAPSAEQPVEDVPLAQPKVFPVSWSVIAAGSASAIAIPVGTATASLNQNEISRIRP